jgi:hypothetical protein
VTWSGSLEGGSEEFEESWPGRASGSVIRGPRRAMTARIAAWASGGVLARRSAGIGGVRPVPRV